VDNVAPHKSNDELPVFKDFDVHQRNSAPMFHAPGISKDKQWISVSLATPTSTQVFLTAEPF
jgi:hypothetical protein